MDVSALIEQVIDHGEPSPVRSFPQHGATVRTDAADPRWFLRQYGLNGLEVAAPGGSDRDLEKITGFSRQNRHCYLTLRTIVVPSHLTAAVVVLRPQSRTIGTQILGLVEVDVELVAVQDD